MKPPRLRFNLTWTELLRFPYFSALRALFQTELRELGRSMSSKEDIAFPERTKGLNRRLLLQTMAGASMAFPAGAALAQNEPVKNSGEPKEIRIAYQRGGILVLAQQQKVLEKFFQPNGTDIVWKLFSYGNPALEAVNVGSMDFSSSGNTPIIFAQAAGYDVQYVAAQRSGDGGEGIVVLPQSGIQHVGELKGKKVAVAKGTSSHYFLIAALQKAGLGYEDVTPVFLAPADAPGALSRGDVSAWVVWDPYLALAEQKFNGKVIEALGPNIKSYNFLVVRRGFANEHSETLKQVLVQFRPIGSWAQDHRGEIAQQLAEITGIELETQRLAAQRANYAITPLTDDVIESQQQVADLFFKLGLIPKAIRIRDAVWNWQA
jgi:sulfonate transport system substrate-binding protein